MDCIHWFIPFIGGFVLGFVLFGVIMITRRLCCPKCRVTCQCCPDDVENNVRPNQPGELSPPVQQNPSGQMNPPDQPCPSPEPEDLWLWPLSSPVEMVFDDEGQEKKPSKNKSKSRRPHHSESKRKVRARASTSTTSLLPKDIPDSRLQLADQFGHSRSPSTPMHKSNISDLTRPTVDKSDCPESILILGNDLRYVREPHMCENSIVGLTEPPQVKAKRLSTLENAMNSEIEHETGGYIASLKQEKTEGGENLASETFVLNADRGIVRNVHVDSGSLTSHGDNDNVTFERADTLHPTLTPTGKMLETQSSTPGPNGLTSSTATTHRSKSKLDIDIDMADGFHPSFEATNFT